MRQENPRISFGQNERESGITSCGDEWVVPKSPILLPRGKSEIMTQLRQKNILFGIGGKWPTTIEDNCDFIPEKKLRKVNFNTHLFSSEIWIFSQQCSAWFLVFFFFSSAGNLWRWNNGGGAMEEEVERERNAGLECRERLTERQTT